MNHASLFSGIGGPEVAAAMLGWNNVFHCEINDFGRKILEYWFPESESYEDIKQTDFRKWRGHVDVLTGGFPCQPFSYAGQRRGADDDRYLWPEFKRVISEVRSTWVVGENVAGITTMVEPGEVSKLAGTATLFDTFDDFRGRYELRETFTLQRICTDLESHGYAVQPVLIPACAVGAPHRRDRVFIVARCISFDTNDIRRTKEREIRRGKNTEPCGVCEDGGKATISQDSMHCGQLHRPNEEQGSERNERHTCAGSSERICGETSRTTSADTIGSREGTPRPSDCAEGGRGDTNQQPSERGAASEWSDRFYAILRHATDTRGIDVERPDNHGIDCENGRPSSNEATEIHSAGDTRPREFPNRWEQFPSVSPVHRGNDGLPFDVGRLTISFGKWRTEALKAYGNAIVPQVMYEIFRAIELTTRQK